MSCGAAVAAVPLSGPRRAVQRRFRRSTFSNDLCSSDIRLLFQTRSVMVTLLADGKVLD
jgi:hypothetical protein